MNYHFYRYCVYNKRVENIKLHKKIYSIIAAIILILIILFLFFANMNKNNANPSNILTPTITSALMQPSPTKIDIDNFPRASIDNISYAYPNNWQIITQNILGGGNNIEYVNSSSRDTHQPELTIQVVPQNSTQPIDQLAANVKTTFNLTSINTTFRGIPAIQVDGNINLQTMDEKIHYTIYKKFIYFTYKNNVYVIIYSYQILPNQTYNKTYFENLLAGLQLQ